MKSIRIVPIIIFLIFIISGCKTSQFLQPDQKQEEPPQQHLKNFAYIDLNVPAMTGTGSSLPQLKTDLKKRVRELVTTLETDGLCLITSGQSPDLIENLAVEAMLLKPYLVIALAWSGDAGHQNALSCLQEGIADMIIPEADFIITDSNRHTGNLLVPDNVKKTGAEQIVGLDLSALFPDNPGGQILAFNNNSKNRITDSQGFIGFITSGPDTIVFQTPSGPVVLPTENWSVPYRYSVMPDHSVTRKSPWVEFRMKPGRISETAEYDFLCRTGYPAIVRIDGDSLKQYRTGIFFKTVRFKEGPNRVRATVITPDSLSVFYEGEFIYSKTDRTRKPFPLWIDERSVEPASPVELLPEDIVMVSFRGSKGQDGAVELVPGKISIKCARSDYSDYSLYRAEIPLRDITAGKPHKVILKLSSASGMDDKKVLELVVKNPVTVTEPEDFPHIKVKAENSRLVYNLGAPRLGGPIRSELGPGVVLKVNGKMGSNYRVRLSRTENGFISRDDVEVMPGGSVTPSYIITSMACGPGAGADIVTIPYSEPVPYEVVPEPDQNRIVITMFGVETANTWVSHRAGCKIIDKLTWEQTTPETYKIYINLKSYGIWGYDLRRDGSRLVMRIKYPPVYDLANEKPLTGLKIAIEAGHGGSGTGAIGLSGLVEKDINLDLSFRLGDLLKSMGAEVVQVRDSDRDMSLTEKRDKAIKSGADMLISIHANAGGRGYLSVGGTSTYWHNPFWAPLAEKIYNRLLETGLDEFGVVGSFNYTVTRVSQMPSVLVEQAFMTHAGDEERLADPLFRQEMATKIYEGILDYLKYMKR